MSESAAFASLRHSLRALSHSLSLALTPLVDNALVEKLLAIYTQTVVHTATHTTTHALSLTEDKREREKGWAPIQEHSLCAAALLWLLQQTMLLASLHAEFSDLSEKELVALWTRFHALDATLSGVIDNEDLHELLTVSAFSEDERSAVDFSRFSLCRCVYVFSFRLHSRSAESIPTRS